MVPLTSTPPPAQPHPPTPSLSHLVGQKLVLLIDRPGQRRAQIIPLLRAKGPGSCWNNRDILGPGNRWNNRLSGTHAENFRITKVTRAQGTALITGVSRAKGDLKLHRYPEPREFLQQGSEMLLHITENPEHWFENIKGVWGLRSCKNKREPRPQELQYKNFKKDPGLGV
jgi:hypothetical protein